MEENEKKQNDGSFKTVQNPNTYKTVYENSSYKSKNSGFGKNVLLPFASGILGCSVVLGTCFGVPSIRANLLTGTSNQKIENVTNSQSTGYVNQTSLSNYSDTSIYAANKILPSIVGIEVEYNVNSVFSMFGMRI